MTSHRVLVTGSSGFLGRAIVDRLLTLGLDVIGLDPVAPTANGYHHLQDDLSDGARLRVSLSAERPTHIIHAGGVSGPMVLADRPDRVMAINVTGSLNLIAAALDAGVNTFVFCSSVSAVGSYYQPEPIDEGVPLQPNSPYGCSKAAVEMVLRGLWRKVGLDICILRFTGIYGPGRRTAFVIDDIVTGAVEHRPASAPN